MQPGLVISYFGNSVAVEADTGQVFQCHLHRNQPLPVVGDRVQWEGGAGETGTVLAIEPRRSLLARGDGHGKMKPIAANLDVMAIVMAPPPIFSEYLLDRYLVAAELLAIQPIVVLNKIDLLNAVTLQEAEQRLQPYRAIPCPVILSSVYTENGLQALAAYLVGKTAVLVGPSGVGKTSIIAALMQAPVTDLQVAEQKNIRIGDVNPKGAGKHTTTSTRLYHLPQGGQLIDSPGVREFMLWAVAREDTLRGFKEFARYADDCKFRDCQHLVEPGCAVQAAADSGKISQQRLESYKKLISK
jgi:ribosome biogenesis GTPase